MFEVELKAALSQEQAACILQKLAGAGFLPGPSVQETDVYFDAPDRDFRVTDEAARLRVRRDLQTGQSQSLLTYKGPKTDVRSSTRTELETAVADGATAQKLLEALGYRAAYTVEKTRRYQVRGDVTACVDHVRELGDFMELETLLEDAAGREAAVDELLALLDGLGVGRDRLRRKSYLELLIASATE